MYQNNLFIYLDGNDATAYFGYQRCFKPVNPPSVK